MAVVIAVGLLRAVLAALIVAVAIAGETTAVAVKLIAAALVVEALDKRRRLVFTSAHDVMLTSLALNVPDPAPAVSAKALLIPFL